MTTYEFLVDVIHKSGVETTEYIQKSFSGVGDFLIWISIIFDPAYAYTLYFPLFFPLFGKTGLQTLWATAVAEWLNHVFKWLHSVGWISYSACLMFIALSRVYIAAHFPHQCIAGLLSGVILGHLLYKVPVTKMNLPRHLTIAVGMAGIAMSTYYVILKMGVDPGWTLPLAKKWCSRSSWVHVNTNLFYMFWRYMGTMLGIGFGLSSRFHSKRAAVSVAQKIILVALSVFGSMALQSVIYKGNKEILVYASAFGVHLAIPYVVISLLPWSLLKMAQKPATSHRKDR